MRQRPSPNLFNSVNAWPYLQHAAPPRARPLERMSCILSACVPRKRCVGRTHFLLSHRWHTHKPSGIAPIVISNATRCAGRSLPRQNTPPYPCPIIARRHSTQPLGMSSVFSQNSSAVRISAENYIISVGVCNPLLHISNTCGRLGIWVSNTMRAIGYVRCVTNRCLGHAGEMRMVIMHTK